ncbi:MAG: GlxA family transcriptional regulator [Pseudomonadota bacterium]
MTSETVHRVGFLLLPRFQMLAYVLACETLRLANKVAGRPRFAWQTATQSGQAVAASNEVPVAPTARLDEISEATLLLVCAGYEPLKALAPKGRALLRRRARFKGHLGGLDTGTVVLAELGLLTGYRAVVHWEAAPGFRERYPEIVSEDAIYALDRDRLTAAGGTATGDAMLAWIAQVTDAGLAARTAEALVHGQIRAGSERQRRTAPERLPPPVARALEIMAANLEEPLALAEIARRAGLGQRRLLRLFQTHRGQAPAAAYMALRLERARQLLASSALSAADIGVACGFASPAWFSRAYRKRYGLAPLKHRKLLLSGAGAGSFSDA